MNKKYFRIVPANSDDAARLFTLLENKTFYPEPTSTPALPAVFDYYFDYRQFFIVKSNNEKDGSIIIKTRSEYTVGQFGTDVIPTAEWTSRYKLSVAPTIVALPDYSEILPSGHSVVTSQDIFLNYQYII